MSNSRLAISRLLKYSSLHTALTNHLSGLGMMQAAQFQTGGPEKLYIGTVPIPDPKDGDIRIKVMATAINRADTLQRRGGYSPPPGVTDILGLEAAGVIDKVGPGCPSTVAVGQKVMALLAGGGNAEYVTSPWQLAMKVPGDLSMQQAAAIPEVWLTAYMLLYTLGKLTKKDTVLIHAGGSGVGTAAVQLVKQSRAKAIITAGTQEKIDLAKSLGADSGINYKTEDVAARVNELTDGKGCNLILDCVGSSMYEINAKSVALDGRWIIYGLLGGASTEMNMGALLRKRVSIIFTTLRARSLEYKAKLVEDFAKLALPLFADGNFKPIVQTVMPLSEIRQAHTLMEENKTLGKIVLRVDDAAKEEL